MRHCPFDKRILPGFILLVIVWGAAGVFFHSLTLHILFALLMVFHLYFFRDPIRKIEEGNGPISPADGKVTEISFAFEDRYIKGEAVKIGIFLSVFDVHVTRSPVAGTIEYLDYVPGKFLNALEEESVKHNESNWIGLADGQRSVLVRQIAGIIARRIHCDVIKGDKVEKTQKIGMICYGSRVELLMPKNRFTPAVRLGQKVYAGKTLLGTWQ